jgi:heat shock protein HtpX
MFKRVSLFIITNLLVIATISIVVSVLGINTFLTSKGINYLSLAIFCAIWGTGGAFISLWMSRWIAKTSMGVNLIDPQTASGDARLLLNVVYGLARKVGLPTLPEVGVYDSEELNAFATGPSKNSALVAVSSGLLNNMNQNEVEAVLGHEISHVANGDMVTMTLVQGIINSFALFLSRIIAYAVAAGTSRSDTRESGGLSLGLFFVLSLIFDIVFTFLGSLVVAAFSRHREYRADAGGARLVGKQGMISALRELEKNLGVEDHRAPSLATLKISHQKEWKTWFSTHPPLESRIERIEQMNL